jgi:hypothetical protein
VTRAAIATIAPTLDANMPSSEIVCFAESAALPSSYRSGGLIVNSIVDNVIDDGIVDKAMDLNWPLASQSKWDAAARRCLRI